MLLLTLMSLNRVNKYVTKKSLVRFLVLNFYLFLCTHFVDSLKNI